MKFFPAYTFLLLLLLLGCGPAERSTDTTETSGQATHRIISLNGTLTELLYDLGYGDQVVGVDVTSSYPPAVAEVPKLGHISQLNVEGLLALQPTLVFVDAEAEDKPALKTLADAGVTIVPVAKEARLDNAVRAAKTLADHLPVAPEAIADYAASLDAGRSSLAATLAGSGPAKPRVLFLYARGAGRLMVAGTGTEAAAMIELAGGENAIQSFADFKPLTPEALVEAAPEVILMFTSGLASLDGRAGLAGIPGIRETPAFRQDRIIAMDGHYLLGFGPRAVEAANELATKIHQPATK